MDADNYQSLFSVCFVPFPQRGNGIHAVNSNKNPPSQQNYQPAQINQRQRMTGDGSGH